MVRARGERVIVAKMELAFFWFLNNVLLKQSSQGLFTQKKPQKWYFFKRKSNFPCVNFHKIHSEYLCNANIKLANHPKLPSKSPLMRALNRFLVVILIFVSEAQTKKLNIVL